MSSALLHQAIKDKKQVVADYDGFPRQFCPHVLGYKQKELRVLGYQFGGVSSEGAVRGKWQCFIVSKLSNCYLRDGQWHPDPTQDPARPQDCIDTIMTQVM